MTTLFYSPGPRLLRKFDPRSSSNIRFSPLAPQGPDAESLWFNQVFFRAFEGVQKHAGWMVLFWEMLVPGSHGNGWDPERALRLRINVSAPSGHHQTTTNSRCFLFVLLLANLDFFSNLLKFTWTQKLFLISFLKEKPVLVFKSMEVHKCVAKNTNLNGKFVYLDSSLLLKSKNFLSIRLLW